VKLRRVVVADVPVDVVHAGDRGQILVKMSVHDETLLG
jgi:hypothetical protein